ncbi:hypothetical protein V6N12_028159 [Hibiscus sabdariffa]|uniref:Uncharacterized protein n=1 Tax=Hibiscus sabdariffa TaxID=183260 RepID=A0ABR2F542_9ROSI
MGTRICSRNSDLRPCFARFLMASGCHVVVVACTRHRRDSSGPFDEPRLLTVSSFPFLPPSRSGFDHPRPRMSQIGTRLMWLVRSASSPFDVATVSDPRCRFGGCYGCTRVPKKILSLLFSFSVCASTTQGPKCRIEIKLVWL